MMNPNLHQQPVALDRNDHRGLKLDLPIKDLSFTAQLNGLFVPVTEFSDVCREYPIVFVRTGADAQGTPEFAPIAMLGMTQNDNLYLGADQRWRADYVPVMLRTYPFCIGRLDDQKFAICLDMAWPGVGKDKGLPLFTPEGEATELTSSAIQQLEKLEADIQRTRAVCATLHKLGALKSMRFDATTAAGRKHSVDGFFSVDVDVMQNLPDNTVGELHRNGLLGMVQLHWASMNGMRRLVQWQTERLEAAPAAAAGGTTAH
jgi:hypothetical protein